MDSKRERENRINDVFWQRFVDSVYDSLDYETPMSAKDIEKSLIEKQWGLPKISAINKAINNDLKDKIHKVGKSKWLKINV